MHEPYNHTPQNVNDVHAYEHERAGINDKVAVWLTNIFQDMRVFWVILAWIAIWIVCNATIVRFDPLPWPLLLALASVPQLPLMIVIMVGQGVIGRKQELQADEEYDRIQKIYADSETIIKQNNEIIALLKEAARE